MKSSIINNPEHIYLMMNKPAGYVCKTVSDWNKPVYSLLPEELLQPEGLGKLHTIGRLDLDTEGLLIFTTDGKLSHFLTVPETHIDKTYFVRLDISWNEEKRLEAVKMFSHGFFIEAEKKGPAFTGRPASLQWLSGNTCRLTITEGKFHQVKRMFSAVGNKVVYLKREKMGSLQLDQTLLPGQYRFLSESEVSSLKSFIDSKNIPC